MLGQHDDGEPQSTGRFGGHASQLPGSDDSDLVRAQVASLGDSGAVDTTGTLARRTATMAKHLTIGSLINVGASFSETVAELRRFAEAGLDHAFAVQIFG